MTSPGPFDPAELEQRFAFLDDCPPTLFDDVVTLPVGELAERVAGIRTWRDALLNGTLPERGVWPGPPLDEPVHLALEEMRLARFCRGQPELVDELLRDVIRALADQESARLDDVLRRLRELEELERRRLREQAVKRDEAHRLEAALRQETRHRAPAAEPTLDSAMRRRLRAQAEREAAARAPVASASLMGTWSERARCWTEIADVFGDLGELLGRGWDLTVSVLRHTGWADVVKLRQLVEQLPQLRAVIRSLGRLQDRSDGDSITDKVLLPVRRLEEELRHVVAPHVPAETRGVERSDEIARMLPVEASMLGHPQLRLLWHARRAERALLTYRVEGVAIERTRIERTGQVQVERRRPRQERGPILSVVDTSGSMSGLPERVAKAIVLEALRTAHAERRRCFLYSYGGPGEIEEHELDLSNEGIGRLIDFLGLSFGGGTDTSGPLGRVLERLGREEWIKADVLIATDGEWPPPEALLPQIRAAKENGTRFHGIQIGNQGMTGLHAVCDPVHVFQDWAALGGHSGGGT